ncbi:MAG: hypothetical protein D6796_08185 [Caldilineae bacterium]|nr:MAG: hypothetical protein D6796_08185 [Caldilineae bacterium]
MRRRQSYELWYALMAVVLITAVYWMVVLRFGTIPPSSDLFGHMLGVVGFLMMLMTETLYSLRKRSRRGAMWGRMSAWLEFHIFTGIVGPYMVLLHTAWKFNGLAGVLTLLTVVVVLSGFVGRYIYTAVPRTVDGAEVAAQELEAEIAAAEAELQRWVDASAQADWSLSRQLLTLPPVPQNSMLLILGRIFSEWGYRLEWWRQKRRLKGLARGQLKALDALLRRRRALNRQMASLAMTRRLLALWHAVHVPIGMVLFTLAFIHIIAALYYATLLR